MSYVLRFVQHFRPSDKKAFMELEAKFARLEKRKAEFPKGLRMQPYAGRERTNTLVWECQFKTLQEAQKALALLEADPDHEALFKKQSPYMSDAYTEIYEVLDLK